MPASYRQKVVNPQSKTWLPPTAWLERIIRINSVTDRSNWPVVAFLLPLLKKAGLVVKLHEVKENGGRFFNVVAHNRSLHDKNLAVFHTHLDTVAPGPRELWTKSDGHNPFRLTAKGGRRYGLGAADVKLDFLCKLWAVMQANELPPMALVGTYGEERGLVGARKLLATSWYRPKFALVGEPSLLEIVYAHKGHLVVEVALPLKTSGGWDLTLSYRGKAAHSSTPHLGVNAIELGLTQIFKKGLGVVTLTGGVGPNTIPSVMEANVVCEPNEASQRLKRFLDGIGALRRDLARERDSRFSPSRPTVSVNQAVTTDKRILLTFDVRLLPSTNAARVKAAIAKFVKTSGLELVSLEHDPSLDGDKADELIRHAVKALTAVGVSPKIRTKASCTEAALYREKGAQAFVFGPGRSIGNVHRPNEYNEVAQLETATRFYHEMIRSFAANPTRKGQ